MSKERFETGSVRDDANGKPKFHFLGECWDGLGELCEVLDHGANEAGYGPGNWQKGQPVTRVVDSMMRHAMAIARGEDVDPKSGKTHRGHVMANACFLAHYAKHMPAMEDRWQVVNGDATLKKGADSAKSTKAEETAHYDDLGGVGPRSESDATGFV